MAPAIYDHPDLYARLCEEARAHDLGFYLGLLGWRGARDVLELGVGAGRVAIPLARAGARVLGVDRAPRMLEELARRVDAEPPEVRARIRWKLGDARALDCGERFDLVLMPFNGAAEVLADGEASDFFSSVRRHLRPGGAFAFDVAIPDPLLWKGVESTTPWFEGKGGLARCAQRLDYDPEARVLTLTTEEQRMEASRPARVGLLRQKQLEEGEVEEMLRANGFEVVWRTRSFGLPDEEPRAPHLEADAVAFVALPRL